MCRWPTDRDGVRRCQAPALGAWPRRPPELPSRGGALVGDGSKLPHDPHLVRVRPARRLSGMYSEGWDYFHTGGSSSDLHCMKCFIAHLSCMIKPSRSLQEASKNPYIDLQSFPCTPIVLYHPCYVAPLLCIYSYHHHLSTASPVPLMHTIPLKDVKTMSVTRKLKVPDVTFSCSYVQKEGRAWLVVPGSKGQLTMFDVQNPGEVPGHPKAHISTSMPLESYRLTFNRPSTFPRQPTGHHQRRRIRFRRSLARRVRGPGRPRPDCGGGRSAAHGADCPPRSSSHLGSRPPGG